MVINDRNRVLELPSDDEDDDEDGGKKIEFKRSRVRHAFIDYTGSHGVGISTSSGRFIKSVARGKFRSAQGKLIKSRGNEPRLNTVVDAHLGTRLIGEHLDAIDFKWIHLITKGKFTSLRQWIQSGTLTDKSEELDDLIVSLNNEMRRMLDTSKSYSCALGLDCVIPYQSLRDYNKINNLIDSIRMAPRFCDASIGECLPDFHLALVNTIHCTDAVTSNPWDHLLSKLVPRAGMSRELVKILVGYMFRPHSNRAVFREQIDEIMLCGLLGNYKHVPPIFRASPSLRRVLYALFRPNQVPGICKEADCPYPSLEWDSPAASECIRDRLYRLFLDQPLDRLIILILREYLIQIIDTDPVLYVHWSLDMDYEWFRQTTIDGMNEVRKYLSQHLLVKGGIITFAEIYLAPFVKAKPVKKRGESKCAVEAEGSSNSLRLWQRELHDIITEAYNKTKSGSYRRVAIGPLRNLKKVKGKLSTTIAWVARQTHFKKVYLRDPAETNEKTSITRRVSRMKKHSINNKSGGEQKSSVPKKRGRPPGSKSNKNNSNVSILRNLNEADDDGSSDSDQEGDIGDDEEEEDGNGVVDDDNELPVTSKDDDNNKDIEMKINAINTGGDHLRAALVQQEKEDYQHALDMEEEKLLRNELGAIKSEYVLSREEGPLHPDAVPLTRDRITFAHDKYLRHHIHSLPLTMGESQVFGIVCQLVEDCGGSPSGIEVMRDLDRQHKMGDVTREKWEQKLDLLMRKVYPYTYNLFQAASGIWSHDGRVQIYDLPPFEKIHQMRAMAHRYGIPLADYAPGSLAMPLFMPKMICNFYWCMVCHRIYTIGYDTRRSKKRCFTHGMQECKVNMHTWDMKCKKPITIGSQSCKDQPLACVDMMGKIIKLGKHMYTVCAQPNCGMLFKMNTSTTTKNKYGYQCAKCTRAARASYHRIANHVIRIAQNYIRPSGILPGESLQAEYIPPPLLCCLCEAPTQLKRPIYIFGLNLVVCHNTRKHSVVRKITHGVYEHMGTVVATQLKEMGLPTVIDESIPVGSPGAFNDDACFKLILEYHRKTQEQYKRNKLIRSKKNSAAFKRNMAARKQR